MQKKSRTGLQSKVSHIFAGVPIPRKKRPYSELPEDEVQPDSNETPLEPENISAIEEPVEQEQITESELNEESVVSQESQVEQTQESEVFEIEEAAVEQEPVSYQSEEDISEELIITEQSEETQPSNEVAEDDFAVVASADDEVDISDKAEEEAQAIEQEQEESSESELSAVSEEKAPSLDFLMSPQSSSPRPVAREPRVEDSSKQKEEDKSVNEEPAKTNVVKEPVVEKPAASTGPKLEITEVKESLDSQKQLALGRTQVQVVKKGSRKSSRKITSKSAKKRAAIKPQASKPRQKTMVILVVFLSVVLVVVLGKQFGLFAGSSSTGNTGTIDIPQPPVRINDKVKKVPITWKEPPVYPEDIRDPMENGPPEEIVNPTGKTEFVVRGISIVQGQYLATIGTEQKRKGDKVGDAVIIDITENTVVFERDGESWTQTVGQGLD